MPALKEIKSRLNAVKSTRKITSAMEMVSSAKLRRAQTSILGMLPYRDKLENILTNFLKTDVTVNSIFVKERPVTNVTIIVFSSNSSLCGMFNQNINRLFAKSAGEYEKSIGKKNITVYPIGKKIETFVLKNDYRSAGSFQHLAETPSYKDTAAIATDLMNKFQNGETDRVDMIYHHFKSKAVQELVYEPLLPYNLSKFRKTDDEDDENYSVEYIVEPNIQMLINELMPLVIRQQLFTALTDSNASEHAARTVAMRTATDNADDLIQELTVEYNKFRPQSITNELLDIVRGSMK
ncbi:MAG: ATP synthase F1 subunit gamma [Bacteroidales bacterium]|jgi:F-type H+-transporting ATPase subunit gamma|nr:ATP synthase F1 subunit gamma [Bacteroidales bacterium]MCI2122241.1 ATP synthase F1 subunit gamma [Bacteroidales bacterium]MCI2144801.1 ATP synthase F1 subunit gamma [Bacteroidales bacterium]